MPGNTYNIIGSSICSGNHMLVVDMGHAVCVMPMRDYNRIIMDERRWKEHKWKRRR